MRTVRFGAWVLAVALLVTAPGACAPGGDDAAEDPAATSAGEQARNQEMVMNALTAEEVAAGWRLLFDGTSLDAWKGYRQEELPEGWAVDEGALSRVAQAGDIVTREVFRSFELSLEWKVEEGGNSGILYLATEEPTTIWYGAPEMQVLDDAVHPDGQSPLTSAGAAYALYPAPRGVVRPAGEWNSIRLLVDGTHVEHWMNGQKLLEYELGSEDFAGRVAESKFAVHPEFAQAREGRIGLQDHGDQVWYRNIKIRDLE